MIKLIQKTIAELKQFEGNTKEMKYVSKIKRCIKQSSSDELIIELNDNGILSQYFDYIKKRSKEDFDDIRKDFEKPDRKVIEILIDQYILKNNGFEILIKTENKNRVLVGQRELARIMKCSASHINKLFKADDWRIVKVGTKIDQDKTIDNLVKSGFGSKQNKKNDLPIILNTANNAQGDELPELIEPDLGGSQRHNLEIIKLYEQAKKIRIENLVKEGEYYDKSIINEKAFNLFRTLRDSMQSLRDRAAIKCRAAESDHEARQILNNEIHNILNSVIEEYDLREEIVKKKILLHLI